MGQFSKAYDRTELELKYLEQKVDFLVHLSMAYPLISPFLEGLYLTMNFDTFLKYL